MVHSRVEETTFPIREWTLDCPADLPNSRKQKDGRPDSLHQVCRLDGLKLLALGYLSAQIRQCRSQIFMGIHRCIPDADLVVQM
jgi:hypothetical protein